MKDNIRVLVKNFKLEDWLETKVAKLEKVEKIKPEQISIVIVGDQKIKFLNKKHRKKDKITDVLSFVASDIKEEYRLKNDNYLGEIFINVSQAQRQSLNLKDEILNLLAHGYLHLKGYTHNNEKEMAKMKSLTKKIISKLKIR